MCTEMYYFSGTGNSLFAARELAQRIPDATLFPIVGLLNNKTVQTRGKKVGLVFPVHDSTIPSAVKEFLLKLDLTQSDYIFAVATKQGGEFHGFEKINRILKRKGKRLNAGFMLKMCGNDSGNSEYGVPGEADILALEKIVLMKLDAIKDVVIKKETYHEQRPASGSPAPGRPITSYLFEKITLSGKAVSEFIGKANRFSCDDTCFGCGICEKVCLSKKISMRDRKPVWDKGKVCYRCYACLNFCPQDSIRVRDIPGIKSFSPENGRRPHPYATAPMIAKQKIS